MGSDNTQDQSLRLIEAWHKISQAAITALGQGQFDQLEQLIATGAEIKTRLERSSFIPDAHSIELLREIDTMQTQLIDELEQGSKQVGDQLANLRRNLAALDGYRQPTATPSFLNRHT